MTKTLLESQRIKGLSLGVSSLSLEAIKQMSVMLLTAAARRKTLLQLGGMVLLRHPASAMWPVWQAVLPGAHFSLWQNGRLHVVQVGGGPALHRVSLKTTYPQSSLDSLSAEQTSTPSLPPCLCACFWVAWMSLQQSDGSDECQHQQNAPDHGDGYFFHSGHCRG